MKDRQTRGKFGPFGGCFAPETLIPALRQLEISYQRIAHRKRFRERLDYLLKHYAGRPTPLYLAENVSRYIGCSVYLKREDLAFTGAHKINNTLGQALLASLSGKTRLIAETGAGQHGVATATVAALFGLKCQIYMGKIDWERQYLNVVRMKLLGAKVVPVTAGSQTLKDAINEAMRDWISSFKNTHYVFGTVAGPHPYPTIVRDFQAVIGRETKRQILQATARLPDYLVACVGGGSNSLGLFHAFYHDLSVQFIGVEAAGHGLTTSAHAATLCRGRPGIVLRKQRSAAGPDVAEHTVVGWQELERHAGRVHLHRTRTAVGHKYAVHIRKLNNLMVLTRTVEIRRVRLFEAYVAACRVDAPVAPGREPVAAGHHVDQVQSLG
ncbi:MAG: tryptophan synthase subunit beta [Candidatus Omnitrophica bacterium]|nr:tryptophan synthase subunit beta [Candidatus Omnitrophota bacterium]